MIPTIQLDVVATEAATIEAFATDPTRRQLERVGGAVSIVSLIGLVLWFNM